VVDRLIVMDRGVIVQEGTPKEIMEQPVNAFVAAFRRSTGTSAH
jgi:ABC-type proline/glycine betaine transport system ATPase subunit